MSTGKDFLDGVAELTKGHTATGDHAEAISDLVEEALIGKSKKGKDK